VNDQSELKSLILEHRDLLMEMICLGGESQLIVIRSQAQSFFRFVLSKVFELNLELREELEIMFSKLVLKPLEQINNKTVKEEKKEEQEQESDEDMSKTPHL